MHKDGSVKVSTWFIFISMGKEPSISSRVLPEITNLIPLKIQYLMSSRHLFCLKSQFEQNLKTSNRAQETRT